MRRRLLCCVLAPAFITTACTSLAGLTSGADASTDGPSVAPDSGALEAGDTRVGEDSPSGDASDGGGPDGAGDSAAASDAPDGFVCDPSGMPSESPCVITEAFGVFVSPDGMDSAPGTRLAPKQTVNAAIDSAKAQGLDRVYACGGTYPVSVVVSASTNRDGMSLFGGLSCAAWTYDPSQYVVVAPSSGYALQLDSLTTGFSVSDFGFVSPASASPGESSIAVFANASQNVSLTRVSVVSGEGAAGTIGTVLSNYSSAPAMGASAGSGGKGGGPNTCADGTVSTGGAGSLPNGLAGAGSSTPTVGSPNAGLTGPTMCSAGGAGANGLANPGGKGAQASGNLSASGWATEAGTNGNDGNPGQGGGGGGANPVLMGGGGGGAGGCGGGGGSGGQTGGSSICIASFGSALTLSSCTLMAANAGNGGPGAGGDRGQAGAAGGSGACSGGSGGAGAGGSGGGGGAGGASIGILWSGTTPPTIESIPVASQQSVPGISIGAAGLPGSMGMGALATGTGNPGQGGTVGSAGVAMAVTNM